MLPLCQRFAGEKIVIEAMEQLKGDAADSPGMTHFISYFELVLQVCNGLLVLVLALPESQGVNAIHLAELRDPSVAAGIESLGSLEKQIVSILQEVTYWQGATAEANRAAAASKIQGPKIGECTFKLETYNKEDKLGRDFNRFQRAMELIIEVVSSLISLLSREI